MSSQRLSHCAATLLFNDRLSATIVTRECLLPGKSASAIMQLFLGICQWIKQFTVMRGVWYVRGIFLILPLRLTSVQHSYSCRDAMIDGGRKPTSHLNRKPVT
jgi:hypothetical protein